MKKERNTEQKEILTEYLKKNSSRHLTIQEIQEDLKGRVGLTTIYRIMNSLIKKGIVTKLPFENKQGYCYKYNLMTDECDSHYHLICEKCNKLLHYESKQIRKLQDEVSKTEGFMIDNHRIAFYGICKECNKELQII